MNLFADLETMVASIGGALVNAFELVSEVFYVPGVDGGVTLIGYLLIAALAVGLIKMGLNLIVRLFTRVK